MQGSSPLFESVEKNPTAADATILAIIYMTKRHDVAKPDTDRPAPPISNETLLQAELLIARWDREGGMSYRELAVAILALNKLRRDALGEGGEVGH